MKDISVTYLGGSGFLTWYGDTGFLFDASKNSPDERILPDSETLSRFSRLFVFVSQHHENTFDPEIYEIVPDHTVFFLGYDIPEPYTGIRLKPGETTQIDGLTVKAYDSTDEGVSFLISLDGITLFHAGNLNLWHWRDESSVTEIEAAEQDFYNCVAPIIEDRPEIDIAFFPVDPRQGSMYDVGAGYFLMNLKPHVMIPMHFQGRGDVALRFAVTNENDATKVIALQKAGDQTSVSIPDSEQTAPDQKLIDFLKNNPAEEPEEAIQDHACR
ncbi:MAG: MBL fold metallo-hydrolase [Clostridia bacterium]|nr:MBL fold metallo-hydrolase [Clostridia bacterium]